MAFAPLAHRRLALTLVMVVALLVGCGSKDNSVTSGTATPPSPTTAQGTVGPPTSANVPVTTTVATSTTTTVAPSSAPSTTVTAGPGWTPVDQATIDAPLAAPCCDSNWDAEPSPPLPAAGQQLADGTYAITLDWPQDPNSAIDATVRRFDACPKLPVNTCTEQSSYGPRDAGIDPGSSFDLELRLDDSLTVLLGGFGEADGHFTGTFAEATGTTFGALLAKLDADYQTAIGDRLAAGKDESSIVATLTADPAHGFSAPGIEGAGQLIWTDGDAPALLFQILNYAGEGSTPRGSDVIGPIALVVDGGRSTLIAYAGFSS